MEKEKKPLKIFDGVEYTLESQEIIERFGRKYKSGWYISVDKVDGKYKTLAVECLLQDKDGQPVADLDLNSVSDDCLFVRETPNFKS